MLEKSIFRIIYICKWWTRLVSRIFAKNLRYRQTEFRVRLCVCDSVCVGVGYRQPLIFCLQTRVGRTERPRAQRTYARLQKSAKVVAFINSIKIKSEYHWCIGFRFRLDFPIRPLTPAWDGNGSIIKIISAVARRIKNIPQIRPKLNALMIFAFNWFITDISYFVSHRHVVRRTFQLGRLSFVCKQKISGGRQPTLTHTLYHRCTQPYAEFSLPVPQVFREYFEN